LILGDNIFFGARLSDLLISAAQLTEGALIFAYPVRDPERYGVVEFNDQGCVLSLEEKPEKPRSKYAVPGVYFYDRRVAELASQLKPSSRGELEITDLNKVYMEMDQLRVEVLARGLAWLDAGTHESLLQAAGFVQAVEDRQGLMIACPEEIAFRNGYITAQELRSMLDNMADNHYSEYLYSLLDEETQQGASQSF
jgi:glucose-1-phosphate thymidylyltransferase